MDEQCDSQSCGFMSEKLVKLCSDTAKSAIILSEIRAILAKWENVELGDNELEQIKAAVREMCERHGGNK